MKTAKCDCGFTVTGETTEEVVAKLTAHAEEAHPEKMSEMADWPQEKKDEMMKKMVHDA